MATVARLETGTTCHVCEFPAERDETGRLRLDRPFTEEERAEQDAARLEGHSSAGSFYQPWATDTEHEARAKRGTRSS